MATVVLTVLASIILFYFIKAGKNLYMISEALKGDFKQSEKFVAELKERLEDNIVFRFFFPPSRKKRRVIAKDNIHKDKHQ